MRSQHKTTKAHRDGMKRLYRKLKSLGVCCWCRISLKVGELSFCQPCKNKVAANSRRRRRRLREEGICTRCGRVATADGKSQCDGCMEYNADRRRRKKEALPP